MPGEEEEDFQDVQEEVEEKPLIGAVSIKPAKFNEAAVEGWFRVLEAQFKIQKVTQTATKFYHVLTALPPSIANNLSNEVMESENYNIIRQTVIDIYEQTKPELFNKLATKTSMTITGRPSVFLQELRSIATKVGINDELVKHKFISALPSNVGLVIASQKEFTLQQIGKLADELMPLLSISPSNQVSTVNEIRTNNSSSNKTERNPRDDRNPVPYGIRPYRPDQKPRVCKAHIYYADAARTCKPWCRWPNKSSQCRMQPSSRSSSPAPSHRQDNYSENH